MWLKLKDRQTTPTHADEHGHTDEESGVSRRRFIIGTVTGVAGLAVSRFLPPLPGLPSFLTQSSIASADHAYCCYFEEVENYCTCASGCGSCPGTDCDAEPPDEISTWSRIIRNSVGNCVLFWCSPRYKSFRYCDSCSFCR